MTTIYKAQPIGDQIIADLNICAIESVPEQLLPANKPMSEWKPVLIEFYDAQGKVIADSLFSSLPGGTLDALLCEMLERKRSLLLVTL